MSTAQETQSPSESHRRDSSIPLVSKAWVQGVTLVMIFGFLILGVLAIRTYQGSMPLPEKIITPSGETLFTGKDITRGQALYQSRGLMQYGSVLGHGAYLGPDYTAEYLRKATDSVDNQYRQEGISNPHPLVVNEFRTNRYDPNTKTLIFTEKQAKAFQEIQHYYADYFGEHSTKYGLLPNMITDPHDIRDLTAFFSWTAWASAADRPGHHYSYTNNWPAEQRVENKPTGPIVLWSALSLTALIGGLGIALTVYGRWSQRLGWQTRNIRLAFKQPGEVPLTSSQRAAIWIFAVVALLFFLQTLMGGAVEHYRADLGTFYGIDLAKILPYNLARTWHLQLSLFWTAAAFLAGGIFLVPFISRREPRHQSFLVYLLLGALTIVVIGSMSFEALSIYGKIKPGTLFSQQWEYIDLPRLFQILLIAGMVIWIIIIGRGMHPKLRTSSKMNLPWMFFFTGLTIPTFYAVSLLAGSETHYSVADFWRFWMVHLWVEDFLELFTTVMVAYIFVQLGVVREKVALIIVFSDIILYSAGGIVGTMHHLYFSGTPVEHMAYGAFFSAAEVIPLTLLTVEAWAFLQLGAHEEAGGDRNFPARWAVMFLIAVGFWNFLGAGIFGFLINLPIVSYYEIGTALTANHAHASMFGVYGMLAVALAMFAFRYVIPANKWPYKLARMSFWGMNVGLIWMVFVTLLPLGLLQLVESVGVGYYEARSLSYITQARNATLEWLRLPGDSILILFGVIPFCWIALVALRHFRSGKIVEEIPDNALYAEIQPEPIQNNANTH